MWKKIEIRGLYDWTTGAPHDGNEWKKYRAVPRAHPSRTLLYAYLTRSGSKGLLAFQGWCGIASAVRSNLRRSSSSGPKPFKIGPISGQGGGGSRPKTSGWAGPVGTSSWAGPVAVEKVLNLFASDRFLSYVAHFRSLPGENLTSKLFAVTMGWGWTQLFTSDHFPFGGDDQMSRLLCSQHGVGLVVSSLVRGMSVSVQNSPNCAICWRMRFSFTFRSTWLASCYSS